MKKSIQFLEKIYALQGEAGDYFILSVKGPGVKWKDIPIQYNKDQVHDQLESIFEKYPPEDYDLYFSPMPFDKPHRKIEYGKETKFMIQDIDELDDSDRIDPAPSYLWESSPNKYQGIWELDRYISESEYTPLNKALAHHIGCDDCFDWCHVYRIPGTVNHKYKDHPQVSHVTATRKIYKPKTLTKLLKVKPREEEVTRSSDLNERKIYAKYDISKKVRDMLALDSLEGIDRSSTIWYIENSLSDLGMTPQEIIYLVKNSIFNKYAGRSDEDKRLRSELKKIISGQLAESSHDSEAMNLEVSTFSQVMTRGEDFSGWLVKGFWGKNSHGIVAGMPKCFKSTIAHDLAVSVASGTPFLGKFPVLDPGPVIMVQNENADYMIRDRNEKLIMSRGIAGSVRQKKNGHLRVRLPKDIPLYFINQQGFMLSSEEHRKKLEELIQKVHPVLVMFDPLYLMFDGEINSAKELTPALNWLLYLKKEYSTSIMVIHHYNKGNAGMTQKGGARMMGSIVLYGWVESAWYLSREEETGESSDRAVDESDLDSSSEEAQVVTMTREFRMAGHFPEIDIHLDLGEIGDMRYNVSVAKSGDNHTISDKEIEDRIMDTLSGSNLPTSRRKLAEQTGVERKKLREVLEKLVQKKKVKVDAKGYSIYK